MTEINTAEVREWSAKTVEALAQLFRDEAKKHHRMAFDAYQYDAMSLVNDLAGALDTVLSALESGTPATTPAPVVQAPAQPREPFTSPTWVPVPSLVVKDGDVSEWDASIRSDLWTMVRAYTDQGVRWHLHGTEVPEATPFFLGLTHREARHTAHKIIRDHYAKGDGA